MRIIVVCGNANDCRKMIERAFAAKVSVRQDPFHVTHRFTEKIKKTEIAKRLAMELRSVMYSANGELANSAVTKAGNRRVVESVDSQHVSWKLDNGRARWKAISIKLTKVIYRLLRIIMLKVELQLKLYQLVN